MALTKKQVSELYVAIFNRASEGEGNAYWQGLGLSSAEAANAMLETTDAQEYFGDTLNDDQAFVELIYANTLNKMPEDDAEGIAYWTGLLQDGMSRGQVIAELVAAVEQYADSDDPATAQAYAQFTNRVAVSNYTADNLQEAPADYATSLNFGEDLPVTSDSATVVAAQTAVDELAEAEPVDPGVPGDTVTLTAGFDNETGTADNDTFEAYVGANQMGQIVNSLQTGDRIDGGEGTDTLDAEIFADGTFTGATAVRPVTTSVENVFVNALAVDNSSDGDYSDDLTEVSSQIRLNADRMDDLEQLWSNGSEASLRVENVANPGDTEALTIGMRSTGNAGSLGHRLESNYEVYFQEDELTAGQSGQGSFVYDLLNQAAYDLDNSSPVDNFPLESIRFDISFAGAESESFRLLLEEGDLDSVVNHQQLVSVLNSKLSALRADDSRLNGLSFEVQGTFTDTDGRTSDRIQLTDSRPNEREITNGTIRLDEEASSGNLFFDTAPREANIADDPVTATVILDDVGRGSAGGFLRVGSMSEGSETSTGIEVYDLTVERDSSLSGLYTTNGTLDTVLITSGDGFDGDLAIGNVRTDDGNPYDEVGGDTLTEEGLSLIQTSDFAGNLSLGTSAARVQDLKTLDTVSMTDASKSTTFWGNIDEEVGDVNADLGVYSYNTGAGADTVDVTLGTDALDTTGTSLDINTNGGDDTVNLTTVDETGASQQTMEELDNVNINTGAGNDRVNLTGNQRANIDAGAGNDFVIVDANEDDLSGEWLFGQQSGPQAFGERVLYQADLTVTFAGFESTVKVPTDAAGNYVATQMEINEAIREAISQHPDLVRLLQIVDGEAEQQLIVRSIIDGENDLAVEINQPEVVANNADADLNQVNAPSGSLSALAQGFIDTTALTSTDFDNGAAGIEAAFAGQNYNGNVDANGGTTAALYQDFLAGGSTDSATGVNYSVVNMGTGAEDLVVFDSNEASANVLEVDGAFGHVSVVNFHDISPNDVAAADTTANVGNHAIDFTSILDNRVDPSVSNNNQQSAVGVAITLNTNGVFVDSPASTGTALANSVNMLNYDETATDSIAFESLTAAQLVAALNGDAGTTVTGGLVDSTLNAATNTANLIGNVQKHIVMVENDENPGEYKVFSLTSTIDGTPATTDGDFDTGSAVELGTMDFGASINFQLVGSEEWETTIAQLIAEADGREVIEPEGPTDPPVDETAPDAPTVALFEDTGVADDNITNNGTLAVGAEDGATVEYSTDGETWTEEFTAEEGDNTVQVRATDAAGNVSDASEVFTFTLDTTVPEVATLPADGSESELDTFTVTFNEEVTGFTNDQFVLAPDGMSASFTEQDEADITNGTEVTLVGVTDVAGNSTDLSFTISEVA